MTAPDAARLADWRALAGAVETIKATGGAVEIAGVRIEPCDTYGATETTRERDALRAELSAIHATTEWQRWARAVTERDAARDENARLRECIDDASLCIAAGHRAEQAEAAVRRVEALCDEAALGSSAHGTGWTHVDDVRAALAGPGATT